MTRPVVVCVGEALWDVYPDAAHFGGAPANVAMHCARLGAEAWLVTRVGTDARGEAALEVLAAAGVRVALVQRDPQLATGEVRVTLDGAGVPSYEILAPRAWDALAWDAAIGPVIARADAVCFGTLAQRDPRARATIARLLEALPASTLRLFDVNLRPPFVDEAVVRHGLAVATALKLNADEVAPVAALAGHVSDEPVALAQALHQTGRYQLTALTRGGDGSVLFAGREASVRQPPPTHVVDTVGAGDAFTAALLLGTVAGQSLEARHARASALAAYVCTQPGAAPPLPADLIC